MSLLGALVVLLFILVIVLIGGMIEGTAVWLEDL